jgi:putative photosynthetic complex assembly protein
MPHAPSQAIAAKRVMPLAIGTLLLVSILGTATVRLLGISIHEPDAAPVTSRSLRFEDGADGSVIVIDAATGTTAARLTGEQGFLRVTLRTLSRERKRDGSGSEQPFELTLHADGRLTLIDPSTRKRVDLDSFGPTNAGVFARLLDRTTLRQP